MIFPFSFLRFSSESRHELRSGFLSSVLLFMIFSSFAVVFFYHPCRLQDTNKICVFAHSFIGFIFLFCIAIRTASYIDKESFFFFCHSSSFVNFVFPFSLFQLLSASTSSRDKERFFVIHPVSFHIFFSSLSTDPYRILY